jgi:hypothetical protein
LIALFALSLAVSATGGVAIYLWSTLASAVMRRARAAVVSAIFMAVAAASVVAS